jgi:hypothetical protein
MDYKNFLRLELVPYRNTSECFALTVTSILL